MFDPTGDLCQVIIDVDDPDAYTECVNLSNSPILYFLTLAWFGLTTYPHSGVRFAAALCR